MTTAEALFAAAAQLAAAVGLDYLRLESRAAAPPSGGKELRDLYRDCARVFERARALANDKAGHTDSGAGR